MHDKKSPQQLNENPVLTPTYASREMTEDIPKHSFPQHSTAPGMVYNLIHDELILDGNSRQNLATFVTTWMEPEAKTLTSGCFDKNMIDKDEYPQTAETESRCVNMLSNLWHSPDHETATGTSTVGSSEAAMPGGMDGSYEPLKEVADALDKYQRETGIDVPVHVDGASGAFIAPFHH